MTQRILVTGSRTWTDSNTLREAIDSWIRIHGQYPEVTTVVHGDASRGADRLAKEYAELAWWLEGEAHPADWSWGKGAGMYRNQDMVDLGADVCLAFIKNSSRGATHCAKIAREAGIPVIVYREEDELTDDDPSD